MACTVRAASKAGGTTDGPSQLGVPARTYKLTWPAPNTFWGGGIYRVKITVRDRDNNWSGQ